MIKVKEWVNEMQSNELNALTWITAILKKYKIPFQIAGGFAARAYGSTRPLEDIDIDIPDDKFAVIQQEISQYTIYGPSRYKDERWDILLQRLDYNGQYIDLSGADSTKILNQETGEWQIIVTEFQNVQIINISGLDLPIIRSEDLIAYKSIVAREVDLIDIVEITKSKKDMF